MALIKGFIRTRCRDCGKRSRKLTTKKLCMECMVKRMRDNVKELKRKEGPSWDKWKAGMKIFLSKNTDTPKNESKDRRERVERIRPGE